MVEWLVVGSGRLVWSGGLVVYSKQMLDEGVCSGRFDLLGT